MAITLQTAWSSTVQAVNESVTKQYPTNLTPGSLLVAVYAGNNAPTISDSVNGSWTVLTYYSEANIGKGIAIAYKENNQSNGTPTVTGTDTGDFDYKSLYIAEYTNVATVSPVDGTPTGSSNSGTAPLPGNITSTGNAVFIGASVQYSSATPTVQTNYAERVVASVIDGNSRIFICDRIVGTGGTTSNPGYTSTQSYWAAAGVAFKAAAGASAVKGRSLLLGVG